MRNARRNGRVLSDLSRRSELGSRSPEDSESELALVRFTASGPLVPLVLGSHRATLPDVLRVEIGMSVGPFRRFVEHVERQLPDAHARPELDGQGRDVGQFQRDLTVRPTRVHESGSGVDEQAQSAQTRRGDRSPLASSPAQTRPGAG